LGKVSGSFAKPIYENENFKLGQYVFRRRGLNPRLDRLRPYRDGNYANPQWSWEQNASPETAAAATR